jgi:hypothetical protein
LHLLTLFAILQAQAHFPVPRVQIPPPEESTFVVAAREALPATRTTSAQNRGGLTARGRTNVETHRGRGRGNVAGRGRGRGSDATTPQSPRGRGKGSKRKSKPHDEGATSHAPASRAKGSKRKEQQQPIIPDVPQHEQENLDDIFSYNTGPGSTYYLMFGDDRARQTEPTLPDLNQTAEEIQSTQNAPPFI